MKTLLVFLVGLAVGALALYLYRVQPESANAIETSQRNLSDTAHDVAHSAASKTRQIAANVSEAFSDKIQDWHLTPADIKADLAKTGEVARANASRAEEKIADTRIVAVIKAKFVLDRDLSVHAIEVRCTDGDVLLTGTVPSEALVGRAVAHALDTEGVHHVRAKLTVAPAAH